MATNALKLSIMVGEIFEIYLSRMAKNVYLNCPPCLEKILKFTCRKWLKMHLNYCPLWLDKFFKFTLIEWLKMHLIC